MQYQIQFPSKRKKWIPHKKRKVRQKESRVFGPAAEINDDLQNHQPWDGRFLRQNKRPFQTQQWRPAYMWQDSRRCWNKSERGLKFTESLTMRCWAACLRSKAADIEVAGSRPSRSRTTVLWDSAGFFLPFEVDAPQLFPDTFLLKYWLYRVSGGTFWHFLH